MKPAVIPLEDDRQITRGDDWAIEVYLFADEGVTLQDLTGYTGAKAQIRETKESPDPPMVEITVAIADQTTNRGLVNCSIPRATTGGLTPTGTNRYVWDLEIINPANIKETRVEGPVVVEGDVTHA